MKNQLFAGVALSAIIFLTSSNLVAGQIRRPGSCPTVTPKPNYDINDYYGKWWIQQKYPAYTIKGGHCLRAEQVKICKNTYTTVITQLDENNQRRFRNGTGRVVGNAHFLQTFESIAPGVELNYWILATDYKTYNVLFRCDEAETGHDEFLWILTRHLVPSDKAIQAGRKAIIDQGLSLKELGKVNNTDCNEFF